MEICPLPTNGSVEMNDELSPTSQCFVGCRFEVLDFGLDKSST